MQRLGTILFVASVAVCAAGCASERTGRCTSDDDCRRERVCSAGRCVTPPWGLDDDRDVQEGDGTELEVPPTIDVPERITLQSEGGPTSKLLGIRNSGGSTLRVTELAVEGARVFSVARAGVDAGPASEPIDGALPLRIGSDRERDVRIWFRPDRPTNYRASLAIRSNAAGGAATVELVGRSVDDPPPSVCLKPVDRRGVEFGAVYVSERESKKIAIENCGARPVRITDISASPSPPFRAEASPGGEVPPGEQFETTVEFRPPSDRSYGGVLQIETDASAVQPVEIPLSGRGRRCDGPEAKIRARSRKAAQYRTSKFTVRPATTIQFDATESSDSDGVVESYEWSVVDRPGDSTSRFRPGNTDPSPTFFVDRVGTYEFELRATDDDGFENCRPERITIEARPQRDIYVSLTWDTPNDSNPTDDQGADLDLHYMNKSNGGSWNEAPWDIYWNNQTADWGQKGVGADNPRLRVEDTDGAGPEAVAHDSPAAGSTYAIGVYYYDDHGYGASLATVRIYIDQALVRTFSRKKLGGTFWFWHVAQIEWPSQNVYERDEVTENGFP